MQQYAISVYKQYFNFSSAHFVIFDETRREPLHGHNYLVRVQGDALELDAQDMVFDFLDIKPLIREICQGLDHKVLLPTENPHLKFGQAGDLLEIWAPDAGNFRFPANDVILLPLSNTTAERLAIYLAQKIDQLVWQKFHYHFKMLEVEVEETPGQSARFRMANP